MLLIANVEKDNQIPDILCCYFFGNVVGGHNAKRNVGISGFAIPDLGILYKNKRFGTSYECQYKGLMSLLKFIEGNLKAFKGFEFEFYTDAAVVAYHLTHHKSISDSLKSRYKAVRAYMSRIPFKVSWIPSRENPARSGMLDAPPLKTDIEIIFDEKKSPGGINLGNSHI